MKIRIDIECESISEFWVHLAVLKKQIKKEAKRLKLNALEDRFPKKGVDLDDNNCYGTHTVKIKHTE
mgnify:CR=1 FL=1